jgi:hypothetical protein
MKSVNVLTKSLNVGETPKIKYARDLRDLQYKTVRVTRNSLSKPKDCHRLW